MQCNKNSIFKAKKFGKREIAIRIDKYLFIIIAIEDNKMKSWFLVIADTTYNYFPTLLGIYLIHQKFTHINKVKELILF